MLVVTWGVLGAVLGLGFEFVVRWLAGQRSAAYPGYRSLGRRWVVGLAALSALLHALLATRWPLGPGLVTLSLYVVVLLVVAVIDLRHRLVYPRIVYPASLLAWVLTPLVFNQPAWSGVLGALTGGAAFGLIYLLARLAYGPSDALGFGDVLIAGLVGAMVGFPAVGSALLLGAIFGGMGAAGVGLHLQSRRAHFPYGPALCLGALVTLLTVPSS